MGEVSLSLGRGRGRLLVEQMRQPGAIATEPLDVEQIGAMQPYQKERRRAVLARLLGVVLKGRKAPIYRRFGLLNLSLRSSVVWLLRNAWGTFKRIPFRGAIY
jgi:coenzyme F420 hydrogenase subunit beta